MYYVMSADLIGGMSLLPFLSGYSTVAGESGEYVQVCSSCEEGVWSMGETLCVRLHCGPVAVSKYPACSHSGASNIIWML